MIRTAASLLLLLSCVTRALAGNVITNTDPVTHKQFYSSGSYSAAWDIAQIDSLPLCRSDMVSYTYSKCSAEGVRFLAHYYNTPCRLGFPLPPNVNNLPCAVNCASGSYLQPGAVACSTCKAGTFSLGGGKRWDNWPVNRLPAPFKTYCRSRSDDAPSAPDNCKGWVGSGAFVSSGETGDGVESVLEMHVELTTAGRVVYIHRVDAEVPYDGLYVEVNGKSIGSFLSYEYEFKSSSFELHAGFHTVRFVYSKDQMYKRGQDKAFIAIVDVFGTSSYDDECQACKPGYHSTDGSFKCAPCPADSFAPAVSSATCTPCPQDQYSHIGSSACFPRPPCTSADFSVLYGECTVADGVASRTRAYSYVEPHVCRGGAELPPATSVPCASCDGGYERNDAGACTPCKEGWASAGGDDKCRPCPEGSMALDTLSVFHSFTPLGMADMEYTTSCDYGMCPSGGWRLLGESMDSGIGSSEFSDSSAVLRLNMEVAGMAEIVFSLVSSNTLNVFNMFVGMPCAHDSSKICWGSAAHCFCVGCSPSQSSCTSVLPNSNNNVSISIDAGVQFLKLAFHREPPLQLSDSSSAQKDYFLQASNDRAIVRSIIVRGFSGRPSSGCTTCPIGTFAAAASPFCRECPAGMIPSTSGNSCELCAAGTFQPTRGGTKCLPCGEGLMSGPGSSFCSSFMSMMTFALDPALPHITTCRYHHASTTYDTRPLAKLAAAQQRAGVVDNSTMQYYFSVCPEMFNSSQFRGSCVGKNGRHVDAPSCQITTSHFSYAIGRYPSFSPLPPCKDAGNGGFTLTLWDGDASAACATRNTTIYLVCDPDADVGSPTTVNGLAEQKACMYSFVWRSAYACPICTMQDVAFDRDVCVNGNRSVTAYWRSESRCFDKQRLPSRYFEPCEDLIVDRSTTVALAVVVALLILILVVSLLVLYIKHRRVYSAYSQLKEASESDMELEMAIDGEDYLDN